MPTRLRSLLPAFALVAIICGCAGSASPALREATPSESVRPAALVDKARPNRKHAAPKHTLGDRAARIALQAVGVPYRWGGASLASGFDCSGLVYWTYRRLGLELPHSSYALHGLGRRVARSRMKPGDVLFFFGLGHVGLYLGNGRMIHAPESGRHVEVVELRSSYYGRRLVGARRLIRS
jgi:cell wall-associated NlpC family hydrolase